MVEEQIEQAQVEEVQQAGGWESVLFKTNWGIGLPVSLFGKVKKGDWLTFIWPNESKTGQPLAVIQGKVEVIPYQN